MKCLDDFARAGRDLFNANTWKSYALWCAIALVVVALLVWFLGFSGFGAPAAPVYEGF